MSDYQKVNAWTYVDVTHKFHEWIDYVFLHQWQWRQRQMTVRPGKPSRKRGKKKNDKKRVELTQQRTMSTSKWTKNDMKTKRTFKIMKIKERLCANRIINYFCSSLRCWLKNSKSGKTNNELVFGDYRLRNKENRKESELTKGRTMDKEDWRFLFSFCF